MKLKFKIHNDTNSNCSFCGEEKKHEEQRWHLSEYFGFNGTACHECYYKIAHDAYGNPRNPEEFVMMVLKHVNH